MEQNNSTWIEFGLLFSYRPRFISPLPPGSYINLRDYTREIVSYRGDAINDGKSYPQSVSERGHLGDEAAVELEQAEDVKSSTTSSSRMTDDLLGQQRTVRMSKPIELLHIPARRHLLHMPMEAWTTTIRCAASPMSRAVCFVVRPTSTSNVLSCSSCHA
jgi:hypothetical protein